MANGERITFGKYKRQMMKAAVELGYDMVVVTRIENSKNDTEITDIMNRARRESMTEDKWKALDKKVTK